MIALKVTCTLIVDLWTGRFPCRGAMSKGVVFSAALVMPDCVARAGFLLSLIFSTRKLILSGFQG